ncbi:hypothetical protein [Photobacterium sp. 53610]|uniref:hypothetical protein n=1 Tax=Photobacterium sp. 53610 TaxID=3102789 RepID=UPI002ED9FD03
MKFITEPQSLTFEHFDASDTEKMASADRKRMQTIQSLYTRLYQQELNYQKQPKIRRQQYPNAKKKEINDKNTTQ